MKTVQNTLLYVVNSARDNGTEYQIARYLLEHPRQLTHDSLIEMSMHAGVSVSTLNRFCRGIGYQNYSTLRDVARIDEEEADTTVTLEERRASGEELRAQFLENIEAIDGLDRLVVSRAAELFLRSPHVYVVGYGGDAQYPLLWFQARMLDLGKLVELRFQEPDAVTRLNPEPHDLLVVASATGGYLGYFGASVDALACRKLLLGSAPSDAEAGFDLVVPCGVHTNIPLRKYALMHVLEIIVARCRELR